MKKVMILSVGGSAEPVINAVKKGKADYYYFFCSSGPKGSDRLIEAPGDPCGDPRKAECPKCSENFFIGNPKGPSIIAQTGLSDDQWEIIRVADPDDLDECYKTLLGVKEKIFATHGDACLITANYTGGTKTMSVALGFMGIFNESWQLNINKGPRQDLIKVRIGDTPVAVDKTRMYAEHQLIIARKAIQEFDYARAESVLSDILSYRLDRETSGEIQDAVNACRAFDHWDKFNHETALNLLKECKAKYPDFIIALKKILGLQRVVSGYEMVGDLLNNAERRAHRGYYDDAVGRLYRATELFAQIRLKTAHNLDSAEMKLADLPAELRPKYASRTRENNKLLIGLREDYALLADLNDTVGIRYENSSKKITDILNKRNKSIFAHGVQPLSEGDYRKVRETLAGFIADCASAVKIEYLMPQMPREGLI
ncbi:MAG TPA: TIGR02710 family CRISPR-associated CARF protein [Smithellaceae bacterium]|nr:TIGR02710 family CRISPR-associated CARF protein [Smithellaceae bacterium]